MREARESRGSLVFIVKNIGRMCKNTAVFLC